MNEEIILVHYLPISDHLGQRIDHSEYKNIILRDYKGIKHIFKSSLTKDGVELIRL